MKVAEFLSQKLQQYGLRPDESVAVLDRLRESDIYKPIAEVLDKDIEGYPPQFAAVALLSAKNIAIEFLEETKPMHFALFMLKG